MVVHSNSLINSTTSAATSSSSSSMGSSSENAGAGSLSRGGRGVQSPLLVQVESPQQQRQ
jgi:hypothetical protein